MKKVAYANQGNAIFDSNKNCKGYANTINKTLTTCGLCILAVKEIQ